MPTERISKKIVDISMSFKNNQLNFDLIAIKNENSIARSVRNLVLTANGERFFNQNLGSGISRALFENIDPISASTIQDQIRQTIENYEPRVDLIDVAVSPDYDNNTFNVTLRYNIVGIDVLPQELSFALQPTR